MTSPFKATPGFDCRAKDMFDVLTFIHDLGMWDELVYEYAEDPKGLISHINEKGDDVLKEWEKKNLNWTVRVDSYGGQKIQLIKVLREFSNLGLAEAKCIVEACPIICPWVYNSKNKAYNSDFVSVLNEIKKVRYTICRLDHKTFMECVKGEHRNSSELMYGKRIIKNPQIDYELFRKVNPGKLKEITKRNY